MNCFSLIFLFPYSTIDFRENLVEQWEFLIFCLMVRYDYVSYFYPNVPIPFYYNSITKLNCLYVLLCLYQGFFLFFIINIGHKVVVVAESNLIKVNHIGRILL